MSNKTEPSNPSTGGKPRVRMFDAGLLFVTALAVVSVSVAYYRFGSERVGQILIDDVWLLTGFAPKVVAGILVATFLSLLLPRQLVARWLGEESGIVGLLIATVAGMVIPGGPGVIMPLGMGLLRAGADRGCIAALITGWVLLGVNRIMVWEISFFDTDFVIMRMLITLPAPVLVGLAIRILVDVRPDEGDDL